MQSQKTISLPKIEVKQSKIHGLGLYASQDIKKNVLIAEYKGDMISNDEADRRSIDEDNPFIMCFDDDSCIDGDCKENLARFVNHCCDANVTFEVKEKKMWCIAMRDIKKGEELTTDYEMDCHELLPCNCGTDKCRHYQNHPEDIPELIKEAEEELNEENRGK